ncbi:MAG: DUF1800 family protein [Hyphomicrobium sp.]
MTPHDTAIALRRLGLGPKPGDVKRIAADPRGFVLASLSDPKRALIDDAELEPSHVVLAESRAAQAEVKAMRDAMKDAPAAKARDQMGGEPMTGGDNMMDPNPAVPMPGAKPGRIRREAFQAEAAARFAQSTATDTSFLERLVLFWSNHFAVSISKGQVRGIAGAFEREAIRPHVLGRFGDMLRAVEQHPAMLIYLDQAQSIGPNSKAGNRRGRGLNENLAREILELHTLGVDGGYGQDDVTNLARILTGWTVGGLQQERVDPGRFVFLPPRHEPGAWTVAGKSYEDRGLAAGEACLADLARHPSTARHVALKLARHFVSSDPPPSLVTALETAFRDTEGDLAAVARTLVAAPETWSAPLAKVTSPYEFSAGLARGFTLDAPAGEMLRLAQALGQPTWQPPGPKGWPDADDAWMGPSSIRERLRIAEKASRLVPKGLDPRAVADDLLGPAMSVPTREAVKRAETREQGFVLLIMSPEFQRR